MADLDQLGFTDSSNKGYRCFLHNPSTRKPLFLEDTVADGEDPEQMYIDVVGRYSDRYIAADKKINNRRLQNQRGARMKLTAEEIDSDRTELISHCVTSWKIKINGGTPECNFRNAYEILSNPKFRWIRDILDGDIETDQNFT